MIKWNKIDDSLTNELINRISNKNINKSFDINGEKYELIYISMSNDRFFRSRGLSVYFKHKKSIIRISDHWSKYTPRPKSLKMNCGIISDSQYWELDSKAKEFSSTWNSGRYPWKLYAGKAGLLKLNKSVDHFK